MKEFWFYLSCAQADWEPHLEGFYHDLSRSLGERTGIPESDIGYFGINEIKAGADRTDPIINALKSSRVFIPLFTPAYFLSEDCEREWRIFRSHHKVGTGPFLTSTSHNSLIIPILWVPQSDLPKLPASIASDYQLSEFRESYPKNGLRQLMAADSFREEYQDFLRRFGDWLYQTAAENPVHVEEIPIDRDRARDSPIKEKASSPAVTSSEKPVEEASKIFISYRRNDSEGFAGRLFDQLSSHFGEEQIFMDLDTIEAGEDFIEVIEKAVSSCSVMIAVIGRGWLTCPDEEGQRRLDNPEDFVRLEIQIALQRNIRVIPVLVQGASIPKSNQLPEVLGKLARRNAFELSSTRWRYDVKSLIVTIEKVLRGSKSSSSKGRYG